MKILYLCHRFPFPPKRGGKIRPFNMISHFAREHEVTVGSLVRSDVEAKEGAGLADYCAHYKMTRVRNSVQVGRMLARLPTPLPSSFGYFYSADLANWVGERLAQERFELIFVHCSSVAPYVAAVRNTPKILDFGDMDSQKWLEYARYKPFPVSLGYALEGHKLVGEERRLARKFDLCTTTTRGEWETLESYGTGVPSDWFPNGVDSGYFSPTDEPYDPDTIAFVGRMDYYPNQECMFDFCRRTLPLLQAKRPSLKLCIIGADPSAAVRRLADLPGVTVTGSVPDVRPYLRRSALMVAPLNIARGTQNKILESMAMGVPVITSGVAAAGVDAIEGTHFLVGSSPDDYARLIQNVIEEPALRQRLSVAGRERMLTHHDWERSMQRLDRIVERCLSQRGAVAQSRVLAATTTAN